MSSPSFIIPIYCQVPFFYPRKLKKRVFFLGLNEYLTTHSYSYSFAFEWETRRMRICQSMIDVLRCLISLEKMHYSEMEKAAAVVEDEEEPLVMEIEESQEESDDEAATSAGVTHMK